MSGKAQTVEAIERRRPGVMAGTAIAIQRGWTAADESALTTTAGFLTGG
jgi:hypothetical protein